MGAIYVFFTHYLQSFGAGRWTRSWHGSFRHQLLPRCALQEGFEHKPAELPPVGLLSMASFVVGYFVKWARLTFAHPDEVLRPARLSCAAAAPGRSREACPGC